MRVQRKTEQSDRGVTEIQPGEPGCAVEFTGVKAYRVFPSDTTTIVVADLLLDKEGRLLPVTTDGSGVGETGLAGACALNSSLPRKKA